MYYELYIDVIFIMNFIVNIYVLQLVNHSYRKSATLRRVILSGFLGACLYCVCLIVPVMGFGARNVAGMTLSGVSMLFCCFRIRTIHFFLDIVAKTMGYYITFGGIWIILNPLELPLMAQSVIMGMVAILIVVWKKQKEKNKERGIYPVKIQHKGKKIIVEAFLDTGNHLYEPISGKPVSVISESCLEDIYEQCIPQVYRVIPFQSVGREHGIMKGYPIEKIVVCIEGKEQSYQDIYVCVSDEISFEDKGYQMILHPDFNV